MIGDEKYKYINEEAPSVKINYSFSEFQGIGFIHQWRESRLMSLTQRSEEIIVTDFIERRESNQKGSSFRDTVELFTEWIGKIEIEDYSFSDELYLLIKRFEVTKKIFSSYSLEMRPRLQEEYSDITCYCLAGIICGKYFRNRRHYQALNAHLKINDIVLGHLGSMHNNDKVLMNYSLSLELSNIDSVLMEKKLVSE